MIAPASLAGIHVYFPDPWPKKRHHKRRLLQPAFVHALALRLAPGGYLHVATDWAALRRGDPRRAGRRAAARQHRDGFAPRPAWRPLTKFEQRGLARGHAVFDLLFSEASGVRRRPASTSFRDERRARHVAREKWRVDVARARRPTSRSHSASSS